LREGGRNPDALSSEGGPENVTSRGEKGRSRIQIWINRMGNRMDDPATLHDQNVLTNIGTGGCMNLSRAKAVRSLVRIPTRSSANEPRRSMRN
jgi:hypothetical protein